MQDKSKVIGVIINRPSTHMFSRLLDSRHWFAIVPVWGETGPVYYDLDSKLENPACLGEGGRLLSYLRCLVLDEGAQAFLITTQVEGEKGPREALV